MNSLVLVSEVVVFLSLLGMLVYHTARGKVLESPPPVSGKGVVFYTEGQRMFHWAFSALLLAAALSGYFMLLTADYAAFNFHVWTFAPVAALLLYHAVTDSKRLSEMKFSLSDLIARREKTKGRYDPLKRAFHAGTSLSVAALGVTGLLLWNPLGWGAVSSYFQVILEVHVLSALLLTSLAMFHMYLALMPHNRPLLRAMVTGVMDEGYLRAHYEWKPEPAVSDGVNNARRSFITTGIAVALSLLVTAVLGGRSDGALKQTAPQQVGTQIPTLYGPIANANQMGPDSARLFRLPDGQPGILVKLPNGQLRAFSAVCTHAGCTVGYDPGQQVILCPCHGAEFSPSSGAVLAGPAPLPLPEYPIVVDPSGNVYLKGAPSASPSSVAYRSGGDDG